MSTDLLTRATSRLKSASLIALFSFAATLLTVAPAHAAVVAWTGSGGNTLASNTANWSAGIGTSDTLLIASGSSDIVFTAAFTTSTTGISIYTKDTYSGTVTVGQSSISFASSTFAAASGSFSASTNSVTFGGDVTVAGGTYGTGSGTVVYSGSNSLFVRSGTATIGATTIGGTLVSGGTTSITGNTSVTGVCTVSGGTVAISTTKALTCASTYTNSGGVVTLSGTGKIVNANQLVRLADSAGTAHATYVITDGVYLRVTDSNRNLSASTPDTLSVTVTVASNFVDSETLTLTETGNATGIFTSSLGMRSLLTPILNNGIFEVNGNGTFTLSYTDATDATDTGSATATLSAAALQTFAVVDPSNTSFTINDNAAQTIGSAVTLKLAATDATYMAVSNLPDLSDAIQEPYTTKRAWNLFPGVGTRTVYVRFYGLTGGSSSIISDSILVATGATVVPDPVIAPVPVAVMPPTPPAVISEPAPVVSVPSPQPVLLVPVEITPAPTAMIVVFSRTLKAGASGQEVAALQSILVDQGFLTIPKGVAKGYFGAMTRTALKKYQKSMHLSQTGVFDKATMATLK